MEPGWLMLHSASGNLASGGSYVSAISPDGSDVTVVVETGVAACAHCHYDSNTSSTIPQTLHLQLSGSLSVIKKLSVWQTTANASFVHLPDVTVTNGAVTVQIQPECVYTLSSTSGQAKGRAQTAIPASARFPSSYVDTFESYPVEGMAKYWADQCGSFQVSA